MRARGGRGPAVGRAMSSTLRESRRASHEPHAADPPARATKRIAQDAPGTISRGGWGLWYPHFRPRATPKDGFRGQRHYFARWKTVWTLPSLWTQKNASTSDLEKCTNRR